MAFLLGLPQWSNVSCCFPSLSLQAFTWASGLIVRMIENSFNKKTNMAYSLLQSLPNFFLKWMGCDNEMWCWIFNCSFGSCKILYWGMGPHRSLQLGTVIRYHWCVLGTKLGSFTRSASGCFSRVLGFNSQHPHGRSTIIPVPRNLRHTSKHQCTQSKQYGLVLWQIVVKLFWLIAFILMCWLFSVFQT